MFPRIAICTTTASAEYASVRRWYNRGGCRTCGPRPVPGECKCPVTNIMPGAGKRIVLPPDCTPGPVPLNPCRPSFHHGHDTYKKYKYIFYFIMVPIIITQYIRTLSEHPAPKGPCRDYEYMRIRTKRFPWGDGKRSFFHNEHVNHVPGECTPPPLDCD